MRLASLTWEMDVKQESIHFCVWNRSKQLRSQFSWVWWVCVSDIVFFYISALSSSDLLRQSKFTLRFAAFKSSLQHHRAKTFTLFDRYGSVFHTCGKLSSSLRYQSVEWQKKSWIVSDKYSPRNCKCNNIVWEVIVTLAYNMQHYRIPVQQTVDGVSSSSNFFKRMTSTDIFPLEKTYG